MFMIDEEIDFRTILTLKRRKEQSLKRVTALRVIVRSKLRHLCCKFFKQTFGMTRKKIIRLLLYVNQNWLIKISCNDLACRQCPNYLRIQGWLGPQLKTLTCSFIFSENIGLYMDKYLCCPLLISSLFNHCLSLSSSSDILVWKWK